jgi:hypothetical protein
MKRNDLHEAVADLRRVFVEEKVKPWLLPILDWIEPRLPILTIWFFFRWYDLWIGLYIDRPNRTIYICPVPMFGVKIRWRFEKDT